MHHTGGFISGPYINIWVGKTEVSAVSSWHHICVLCVAPLNCLEHVLSQATYAVYLNTISLTLLETLKASKLSYQ